MPTLEKQPTGEIQQVDEFRKMAREFAASDSFKHHIEQAEAQPKQFPFEFMQYAAKAGFLAMDVPNEYGGFGMGLQDKLAVIEELNGAHGGLGLSILVQNSLSEYPIARFGTDEQKAKYLPDMADGNLFGCFALTEPTPGSDATNIQLKAVFDNNRDGYVVNGTKRFITNASGDPQIAILATRTGEPNSGKMGITTFIAQISPGTPGVTVAQPDTKRGLHGSTLCDIYFDDYFTPQDSLLGEANNGWHVVESTLQRSRIWIAAQGVGIAQRTYDEAEKSIKERLERGSPVSEIPEIINHLAIINRQIAISRFLVQKAARHEEIGDPNTTAWASLAKLIAGETAEWADGESTLLHGGSGYLKETPISQVSNDAPVIRIYEGTAHIQNKIVRRFFEGKNYRSLFPPQAALTLSPDELPSLSEVINDVNTW